MESEEDFAARLTERLPIEEAEECLCQLEEHCITVGVLGEADAITCVFVPSDIVREVADPTKAPLVLRQDNQVLDLVGIIGSRRQNDRHLLGVAVEPRAPRDAFRLRFTSDVAAPPIPYSPEPRCRERRDACRHHAARVLARIRRRELRRHGCAQVRPEQRR